MTDFGPQWQGRIKAKQAVMQKTATNKPQMVVECDVLDGEHKGKTLQYRGLLNPEKADQTDRTIKAMEALGCSHFRADPFGPSALSGLGKTVARGLIAQEEDQNGVERLVIKFVNPDTLVKEESIASDADRARWKDQFSGTMTALKNKPPAAEGDAATGAAGADEEPSF